MTNTRIKLEEAKYFFKRMNEEVANRDPFKYNLSAFLAAARSVTFVMHSEFKHILYWFSGNRTKQGSDLRWKIGYNIPTFLPWPKPIFHTAFS